MADDFKLRMTGGTWLPVGNKAHPLRIRMPDGTWQVLGGGNGMPLKLRMPDGTWRVVTRAGISLGGTVSGQVSHLDGRPAVAFTVRVGLAQLPDGSVGVKSALTDANGRYVIYDVNYGLHPVVLVISESQNEVVFITLNAGHPNATVDYILPGGYFPYHYGKQDFPQYAMGWIAQTEAGENEGLTPRAYTRHSESSASNGAYFAYSTSASGWTGNEAGDMEAYKRDQVGWYSVPIAVMREAALAWMDVFGYFYSNAVLDHIDVVANLYGSSVVKGQMPWMGRYHFGDTTISDYTGTGVWLYQGHTPDVTEPFSWDTSGPVTPRQVDLPVVRNKLLAREQGTAIWSGSLNDLGSGEHGYNRQPLAVTHTLAADYPYAAAQYHFYTSEAPQPRPLRPEQDYSTDNQLGAQFEVDFVFKFG
jgi:hypothetical protein